MLAKHTNQMDSTFSYGRIYRYYVLHDLENFHIALVVLSGILFLISKFTRNHLFAEAGLWVFYFCILSFLVHLNQRRLYHYMSINDKVAYLPARQIRMMNNLFLTVFTITTGILMFILPRTPYQRITSVIGAILKALVSAFLQLFFKDTKYTGLGEVFKTEINYAKGSVAAESETFWDRLIELLEKFMGIVSVVIIVILLFVLIVWIYRRFLRHSSENPMEKHEFVGTEMRREKLTREKSAKKSPGLFNNDTNSKIRKYYQKTIQKYNTKKSSAFKQTKKTASCLTFLTPQEIEQYVLLPQDENRTYLHSCYEKARYSNQKCSAEELAALKKHKL